MTEAKLQQLAANVILCKTWKEAAAQSGISDRTLRNIRKTAEFQEALNAARAEAFERAVDAICAAAPESAAQLKAISEDPTAPASARVAASRFMLEFARDHYNREDILERLIALEEAAREQMNHER